jgi:hypothetical protein
LRLRQRERRDRAAGARALEPRSLRGRAEQADRAGAEPLHREGEVGEPVVARQRLAHQAERADVERARRVGIDGGMLEPTVAAERRDERAARGVDVAVVDRQVRLAPGLERGRKLAMTQLEERPGEEARVRHQLPSNAGRSLATNAR